MDLQIDVSRDKMGMNVAPKSTTPSILTQFMPHISLL